MNIGPNILAVRLECRFALAIILLHVMLIQNRYSNASTDLPIWALFIRMKCCFFAVIVFLFTVGSVFCQKSSYSSELQIKFSPFRLTNSIHPGIELGIEFRSTEKFSTQFSGIFLRDVLKITNYQSVSGYRLALEEKYFALQPDGRIHPYVSCELAFCRVKIRSEEHFDKGGTISDTARFSNSYPDTVDIYKRTGCLNFKIGFQWKKGRCVFDFGLGLGIMYKEVYFRNQLHPEHESARTLHPNIYVISSRPGNYVVTNFPMSFRIGYVFS